jgi:flagellar motor component MotA
MFTTILLIIGAIIVAPVLAVVILTRWYLNKARREIINIHTKKPIENYANTLESLYERLIKKRHQTVVSLERAQKFDFKPYLSVFLHLKMIIVSDPELTKKTMLNWRVFEKQSQSVTPWMDYVMGHNVVFANGDEWKKQRSGSFTA